MPWTRERYLDEIGTDDDMDWHQVEIDRALAAMWAILIVACLMFWAGFGFAIYAVVAGA